MADNLTPLPVKTKADGDVNVDINGGPTGASALQSQGTAADGASSVGNPVLIAGDDGTFVQKIKTDSSGELQVDVLTLPAAPDNDGVDIGDVDVISLPSIPAGSNNIGDVDIASAPTGSSAIEVQGTAADGASIAGDPVQVGGKDGSGNAQSLLTDTDGHLQVDILSGAGAATPTNPDVNGSLVNLATTVSGDVDSTDVGSATLKLAQVVMSSSAPFKARILTVADDAETERIVLFGQANDSVEWNTPHRDYIQQGPIGAGFDGFRVEFTNMDNLDTADFYATFFVQE